MTAATTGPMHSPFRPWRPTVQHFLGPPCLLFIPGPPPPPALKLTIKGAPDCTASKRPTLSSPPLHRTGEPLVYFSVERWGRSPLALTMQDVRLDGGNRHQLIYVRGGLAGGTRGRAGGLHACGGPTGGGGGGHAQQLL